MPQIVRSALVYPGTVAAVALFKFEATAEDVWYADARACLALCGMGIDDGIEARTTLGVAAPAVRDIEAVAIESRERTRSKGYVEPRNNHNMVSENCVMDRT